MRLDVSPNGDYVVGVLGDRLGGGARNLRPACDTNFEASEIDARQRGYHGHQTDNADETGTVGFCD